MRSLASTSEPRSPLEPMTDHDKLLTPQDLATYLNIPVGSVFSLTSRKQVPFVRIGRRCPRYRTSEIMAWLASRSSSPAAQ